jgi:serine/threonine protein kinase
MAKRAKKRLFDSGGSTESPEQGRRVRSPTFAADQEPMPMPTQLFNFPFASPVHRSLSFDSVRFQLNFLDSHTALASQPFFSFSWARRRWRCSADLKRCTPKFQPAPFQESDFSPFVQTKFCIFAPRKIYGEPAANFVTQPSLVFLTLAVFFRALLVQESTPIHARQYDNTEDFSDSPVASNTPLLRRAMPHASTPTAAIPISEHFGRSDSAQFKLSSIPFVISGSPLSWSGSECGSAPSTPPQSPGRNSTQRPPATPTPIAPKHKSRSPGHGLRFQHDQEEDEDEQELMAEQQDVEMTEADNDDAMVGTPYDDIHRMDEDDTPVMETPRNAFEPLPFSFGVPAPNFGSEPRRDLNMSQFIQINPSPTPQPSMQQTQQYSGFTLPIPNMVFTQPRLSNPAPPPTQYKSDTEATRRRALDQQQQRIPQLTISAMSDTSPRRSHNARPVAKTPGVHEANIGVLTASATKQRPAATPLKVLKTNINPWSPDVRQKPKGQSMKIHVDENTPQLILNFHTEMRLGSGSFGEVLLACNRTDGWKYAIKKIRYRNQVDKLKCLNEVYLLAAMGTHPNIIRYHSAWIEEQDMTIYIQTEYCNMGSLTQYALKQTQLMSEADLLDILRQVASALDYLHEKKGVAHLDVKPENVLVVLDNAQTPGGNPARPVYKLADFGLIANRQARSSSGSSSSSDGFDNSFDIEEGDSRYLPRELLEETFDHALLPRADIFALGLSVWELAVRQSLPRQGVLWKDLRDLKPLLEPSLEAAESRSQLTQSAAAAVSQWPLWRLPEHLSGGFRDLLIGMLHPDPLRRPTARKLLEHPMLNGTPLERGELKRMVEAQQNKIVSLKRELQLASNKNKSLRRRESFSGSLTASLSASSSPPLYDSAMLANDLPHVSDAAIYDVLSQRLAGAQSVSAIDLHQLASEIAVSVQSQLNQQQLLRSSSPIPRSSSSPLMKENISPNRFTASQEFAPPAANNQNPACGPSRIVLRRSSVAVNPAFMTSNPGQPAPPTQFQVPQQRPTHLKRAVSDFGH